MDQTSKTQSVIYRQGDVALIAAPAVPAKKRGKAKASKRVVLALGEETGHAHVIEGAVAEFMVDGRRMLWVEAQAGLSHQEHAPIEVLPGWYVVQQQREYSPEEIRSVAD